MLSFPFTKLKNFSVSPNIVWREKEIFLYILLVACLKTKSSGYLSHAAKLCEFRALEIHNSGTFKLVITFFSCSSLENL